MRRATEYEHLDDDGERAATPALVARRQRLEEGMRLLQIRYAPLASQIGALGRRYAEVADRGERS